MKKSLIIITQLFILAGIRLRYFRRVRSYLAAPDNQVKGPIVIAANHANAMDPFIIACFLPVRTILRVFPYGFMTANVFYYRWWKPLAWLAGCYPAKKRTETDEHSKYGVGRSIKLLEDGYSVLMFPEGKRTGTRLEAKPGISYILKDFNAKLLLCHIEWGAVNRPRLIKISLKAADESLDTADPGAIMEAIYSLSYEARAAEALQKA